MKSIKKTFPNIKRGLGITTQLDWLRKPSTQKDTKSSIQSSYPITESKNICELFTNSKMDKLHKELAKSFHININKLDSFEKIIINNQGHCDVTIELTQTNNAEIYIEVNNDSSLEFISTGLTIIANENASAQVAINIKNKEHTLHLIKEVCIQKEKSNITWFTQSDGSKQIILNQKASLIGVGAEVKTISTVLGDNQDKFDITTISHHLAANTSSDIVFKSALSNAQVLARGLVRIEPVANNSTGYQKSSILLLDKNARAITIPDLEIENKDVMCSHGSTITKINEEQLFYLKSRGLSEEEAKNLIIKGFINSIYSELTLNITDELRGEN